MRLGAKKSAVTPWIADNPLVPLRIALNPKRLRDAMGSVQLYAIDVVFLHFALAVHLEQIPDAQAGMPKPASLAAFCSRINEAGVLSRRRGKVDHVGRNAPRGP